LRLLCCDRQRDHRALHSFPTRRSSDLRPSRRRRAAGGSPSPVPHHSTRRRSSSRSPLGWRRACSPASACPRLAPSIPCSTRRVRSEEHTSELQSLAYLVCRLLLEKKKY